jgi:hypothetical protein
MRSTPIALTAAAILVGAVLVASSPSGADPSVTAAVAPRGAVSFFRGDGCPDGWVPAELAAGRILVGTVDPLAIGHGVGAPLGPAEDRLHGHGVGGLVSLPAKNIAAADGGNQSGASAGTQMVAGDAMAAPSGMPFLQLTACVLP